MNRLLHELGYSLQANRKTLEGRQHPDREAQFQRIDRRVRAFLRLGQPVVSVDTEKKESIGPILIGAITPRTASPSARSWARATIPPVGK